MNEKVLSDDELLIVFATAPTGLGHIRVTDALFHGLPETASPILLGAQNKSIDTFYRFVSLHPYTRFLMEVLQTKTVEKFSTPILRLYFTSQTKFLYRQFITILGERLTIPRTILVVATHSALAHQIGVFKTRLEKETNTRILLLVQVTDDSPQFFWYVKEADMIFVPSEYTKHQLLDLAREFNIRRVPIAVKAYPISPLLAKKLSDAGMDSRLYQVKPSGKLTNVSIPVSGAAIGTNFLYEIVKKLHRLDHRFSFHVVSKDAYYTKEFIRKLKNMPYVSLYISDHDRITVNNYENLLIREKMALEITKPSEQAFKSLYRPSQLGGVILLFSKPVGRQEYDNLHFLRVRGLMPSKNEQQVLWEYAEKSVSLPALFHKTIIHWRALRLPEDPDKAAKFITWCLSQKIFMKMMDFTIKIDSIETASNGVEQFWDEAAELLKNQPK